MATGDERVLGWLPFGLESSGTKAEPTRRTVGRDSKVYTQDKMRRTRTAPFQSH